MLYVSQNLQKIILPTFLLELDFAVEDIGEAVEEDVGDVDILTVVVLDEVSLLEISVASSDSGQHVDLSLLLQIAPLAAATYWWNSGLDLSSLTLFSQSTQYGQEALVAHTFPAAQFPGFTSSAIIKIN